MEPNALVEMYPLPGQRRGGMWDASCVCDWEAGENFEDIVWLGVKTHLYVTHGIHPEDAEFEESVAFL